MIKGQIQSEVIEDVQQNFTKVEIVIKRTFTFDREPEVGKYKLEIDIMHVLLVKI